MKKISKSQARKRYLTFKPFVMCASKLNPETFGVNIDEHVSHDYSTDGDFEKLVNEFRYYNCNAETGRGISFYVREM